MKYELYLCQFEEQLRGSGYSEKSIKPIISHNYHFINYLHQNDIIRKNVADISTADVQNYIAYLKTVNNRRKVNFSSATIIRYITSIKLFFKFLLRNEKILVSPFDGLNIGIKPISQRKEIFSQSEIEAFLDYINVKEPNGFLYKAVFELMYSSALRISEINIDIPDIDFAERTVIIRNTKGGKDRIVPFTEKASIAIKDYLEKGRVKAKDSQPLFIGSRGRIKMDFIRDKFFKILSELGMKRKNLTLHSIRYSTATHLLENGMSIRHVQELLSHEDIETTVRYTTIMNDKLKRIYRSYHPRENAIYEEVDDKYLQELERLKQDIITRRAINEKYNTKKK